MAVTKSSEIILVTSGKGGVGKTTTSAAVSMGLAVRGYKTAVVDFDVGLRNLDLIMGCERRVVYDLVNVINGEAKLHQALIKDKRVDNLFILPASQTKDKDALTHEGVSNVLSDLQKSSITSSVIHQLELRLVHTWPCILLIAQSWLLTLKFLLSEILIEYSDYSQAKHDGLKKAIHLLKNIFLVTRYSPARVELGEMLALKDIQDILSIDLLGVILESDAVLRASNMGSPVILERNSNAGLVYSDAVDRLIGKQVPMRFTVEKRKGYLKEYLESEMILSYLKTNWPRSFQKPCSISC